MEQQITQPESDLAVMETCYEESEVEETYTTEELQMKLQSQKHSYNQKGKLTSVPETTVFGTEELPGKSKSKQVRLWSRLQTSVQQREQPTLW